ncbi:MAG: Hint domain-containing protein [Pseudomonadota bacterium]
MAWIGLRDAQTGWFRPNRENLLPRGGVLRRGSLVMEVRLSDAARPQSLLAISRSGIVQGRFSLEAMPRAGIVLVDARGADIRHATLPFVSEGRFDTLRLTYNWDCAAGWSRLSLERPETDHVQSVTSKNPLPLPSEALEALMLSQSDAVLGQNVIFVALSDRPQPVGPMPGLTAQVGIETAKGRRPVCQIRRGDSIYTSAGELVPVLRVVKRTVPARGGFRPIRLRAPFFGLATDAVLAPHERLVMTGGHVEYLFGRETVLVPAAHLVNARSAFLAQGGDLVTYYHLLLAEHDAVLSGECALESLYIGRLRRKQDALAASVLAALDRSRLPEHAKPISTVLKPFEAVALALSRAA